MDKSLLKAIETDLMDQVNNAKKIRVLLADKLNADDLEELDYRLERFSDACGDLIGYVNDYSNEFSRLVETFELLVSKVEGK